ncbi:MAG TPA: NAD(P)-binding domain-containing protein [Jiangellales bacterium]|nr:NAD(P)-binding domain-containing protein [Jiangellales bacterium]
MCQSLWRSAAGRLELGTGEGTITARAVVVATGAYQRALRPAPLAALPPWLAVLDAEDYRNPGALPDGAVLVVGSGQSGCQIAEELCLAGRHVDLACGRAPWVPRRLEGRDIIDWLLEMPFLDASVADLPNPMARLAANFQNTGVAGGHDLNYRTMSRLGVDLVGRLIGVDDAEAAFADDLAESVAFGDARYADVCAIIGASCGARGLAAPDMPDPPPFTVAGRDLLSLRGFGSVVVAAGYRPAWTGSSTRRRSMTSGSRCTATAPARWWRGCTSSASTSCGSGSRHCSSAWVKTPAWLPSRSPASAGPGTGTLPKGTPTPASPAPARADAQVSERIEQILASEVGSSRGHH